MRLSAPLDTSLHPINRHTAGAAGKLIFLLFFSLLPALLPYPSPFPPPPAVALPGGCVPVLGGMWAWAFPSWPRGGGWGRCEPPALPQQPGALWSLSPTGWLLVQSTSPSSLGERGRAEVSPLLVGKGAPKDALASAL